MTIVEHFLVLCGTIFKRFFNNKFPIIENNFNHANDLLSRHSSTIAFTKERLTGPLWIVAHELYSPLKWFFRVLS